MTTLYTSKHSLWLRDIHLTPIKPVSTSRTNKADCFASATTDCWSRKTSSKCCWCRFIKILSMKEIDHRQSDITFVYASGSRDHWGFSSSFNVFTKSSPQWKVFVMTHNQFRFPKWRRKQVWAKTANIQCPSIWAFTANKWIFSVHFPLVFPECVPCSS